MGSYTESVPFIPEQGFRYCGGSDFKNWKECDLKGWVYCQAIPTPLYPFKCIVCPERGGKQQYTKNVWIEKIEDSRQVPACFNIDTEH